jgi:pimeloyl-ACP methyl ester carboxylesterase
VARLDHWQPKIISPLTDPVAYGGKAEDSFEVVIPSLPGYGFSGKPTAPGWTPITIAHAWATLKQRLGYTRCVAQGGNWGDAVPEMMLQQPLGLLGIHTNMAATVGGPIASPRQDSNPVEYFQTGIASTGRGSLWQRSQPHSEVT